VRGKCKIFKNAESSYPPNLTQSFFSLKNKTNAYAHIKCVIDPHIIYDKYLKFSNKGLYKKLKNNPIQKLLHSGHKKGFLT
jgi:hypothetical protein